MSHAALLLILRRRALFGKFGLCLFLTACGSGTNQGSPSAQTSSDPVFTGLSLIIGSIGGYGWVDDTGIDARFNTMSGIARDSAGNLYVTEASRTIRKISAAGVVTTLAGLRTAAGSVDGAGSAARFGAPSGIAADASDNLYVADESNHTIRKITPAGVVSTIAGTAPLAGTADGVGSAARFNSPRDLAFDTAGNLYITDGGNFTIRRMTPAGVVSTLAGSAGISGDADGSGAAASFRGPAGIAVDGSDNLYVADRLNHTIRKITPAGVVTTLAGSAQSAGGADGLAAAARFNEPQGLAVDAAGNVYVGDSLNNAVRKIAPTGEVTTLAGSAGTFGATDGTGTAARFLHPWGVTIDPGGTLFVSENGNHTIRRITSAGVVTTFAGAATVSGNADGPLATAGVGRAYGATTDAAGNLYLADTTNGTIRKITRAGMVSTVAGRASSFGSTDGVGAAARFALPLRIVAARDGNLYVTDNDAIRKITPDGTVSTLAGAPGIPGNTDGTGTAARFDLLYGIVADKAGNLFAGDGNNHRIRKITPAGVVTTFAGSTFGYADGTGTGAQFKAPYGLAIDSADNLYIAEFGGSTIRKITPAGVVTTVAGSSGVSGSDDGIGAAARFGNPMDLTIDPSDNLYVADYGNHTIRKITTDGTVTTVAGLAGQNGIKLGDLPGRFSFTQGITFLSPNLLVVLSDYAVLRLALP